MAVASGAARAPGAALPPVPARRRRTDRVMRGVIAAGTALAVVPLVLVLYYLITRGLGAWSPGFFTEIPNANILESAGGIANALVGSLLIVGLATLIAVPMGIAGALYLSEYGRRGWFPSAIRYLTDVMTGVPSIVFGLFVYVVFILAIGRFTAWAGSIALALLMLPIVIRSAEVVLTLVPNSLREAAYALGAPRWRTTLSIVLPTALPGIVTGVLLAVARASGETAPLLFTALYSSALTTDMSQAMGSMPVLIYSNTQNAFGQAVDVAWGTALALVVIVLVLTMAARLIARRSRLSR
jgi:phosphate transport system permease protein